MSVSDIPAGDGTPKDGQYIQDDSGADMHMINGREWCALGYTTEVNLWAGTAKAGGPSVKLDAVAPLVVAMDGMHMGCRECKRQGWCA